MKVSRLWCDRWIGANLEQVLKGKLQEDLYSWPDQEQIENGQISPPQLTKQTTYGENQVTYMSDKLGLHRISNPDQDNFAISLHRMLSFVEKKKWLEPRLIDQFTHHPMPQFMGLAFTMNELARPDTSSRPTIIRSAVIGSMMGRSSVVDTLYH